MKVTPRVTNDQGNLVISFAVQEGQLVRVQTLELRGNNTVPLSQLAPKGLNLGAGKPFSPQLVQQDRNTIMARYLALGYLTASFRPAAQPVDHDKHRLAVIYDIYEGPKVVTSEVITLGRQHARQSLVDHTARIKVDKPLSETDLLTSESRLFNLGVFDWAQISPRRPISTQSQEDVLIKLHESKRNSVTYGFGFEIINRGGSLPGGTVVVPAIPPSACRPTSPPAKKPSTDHAARSSTRAAT